MNTLPNSNPPAQAGQPGQPAANPGGNQIADQQVQSGAGQQATQEFVTKADLEAWKQDLLRTVQSSDGKLEARINKKLADLKAAGIAATPEQAKALVDAEDLKPNSQQQGVQQGQPAQVAPAGNQQVDPQIAKAATWMREDGISTPNEVTAEAYQMMAQADTRITADDPEYKNIKGSNAYEFLQSVAKAIADKKARQGNSAANVPSLSSGTPSGTIPLNVSGLDVLSEGFKNIEL